MTPFLQDPDVTLYHGDVLDVLRGMPAESVDCVVTSPPYWGLRDYGTGAWEGGDEGCEHRIDPRPFQHGEGRQGNAYGTPPGGNASRTATYSTECPKCGARRVDNQLGLEPTPDQYVQRMVAVFREVRRVLAPHGTCWVNLGDSYAHALVTPNKTPRHDRENRGSFNIPSEEAWKGRYDRPHPNTLVAGLKPKDLVGIPWAVAKALQAPHYTGEIKDERDRIWLAAMVEAEGCLYIHKRKAGQPNGQGYERKNDSYGAGLEVSSTDRVIVERCMEIAGIGSICEQSPDQNARRKQTIYRWNVRSNECRWIISELYPHLIAKQHEARLLIGCPSSGDDARKAWESLKALHQGQTASIDFQPPEGMWERGWFLRSEIIWAKCMPNPMPESVTDRPTKSHEQVFLLTKQPRYFFDAEAVREGYAEASAERYKYAFGGAKNAALRDSGQVHTRPFGFRNGPSTAPQEDTLDGSDGEAPRGPDGRRATAVQGADGSLQHRDGERWPNPTGRNVRSVWSIATQPYPEAHFATYPEELVRRCVLAGCAERVCRVCGKARERIVEGEKYEPPVVAAGVRFVDESRADKTRKLDGKSAAWRESAASRQTTGWSDCGHNNWRPGVVLDPFVGSGTTCKVARDHGRHSIGIDLNANYLELAATRLQQLSLLTAEAGVDDSPEPRPEAEVA